MRNQQTGWESEKNSASPSHHSRCGPFVSRACGRTASASTHAHSFPTAREARIQLPALITQWTTDADRACRGKTLPPRRRNRHLSSTCGPRTARVPSPLPHVCGVPGRECVGRWERTSALCVQASQLSDGMQFCVMGAERGERVKRETALARRVMWSASRAACASGFVWEAEPWTCSITACRRWMLLENGIRNFDIRHRSFI